jgi:hypothetical protein
MVYVPSTVLPAKNNDLQEVHEAKGVVLRFQGLDWYISNSSIHKSPEP